jgi:argininosuccinate synthase
MAEGGTSAIKKVVLAYSGGLDTSIIIPWLREVYDCEVIAMAANLGQGEELTGLKEKAIATGAAKVYIEDLRREFVEQFIFRTLRAGAVYEDKYLLGTSFARPLIAKRQIEIAEIEGADAVSHGCTGKGNDQVRFELTYKALNPKLAVIAPWREWDIRSREDAIDYAEKKEVPIKATREKIFSEDRNLWHLSHEGGPLEDPWNEPPEDMYQLTVSPEKAPDKATIIELSFESGYPTRINNVPYGSLELVEKLNQLGGKNGIGRADLVENRLVGMKSRGVYETPGGTILYTAHREVESLCLDKEVARFKKIVSLRYADLVYNGQWYTPIREYLDTLVDQTQERVTGTVKLKLYKGSCIVLGRSSPFSLYREDLSSFGQDEIYEQKDATGYINVFGLPLKVQAMLDIEGLGAPSYRKPGDLVDKRD